MRNPDAVSKSHPIQSGPADKIEELKVTETVYNAADGLSVYFANKARTSETYIYYLAFGSIRIHAGSLPLALRDLRGWFEAGAFGYIRDVGRLCATEP